MSEIEISHLTVIYRNKKSETVALDDFSAVFPHGINVIVGYSGSGKTTLLRSILGLVEYRGSIRSDGKPLEEKEVKDRNFSYVSQEYVLYPKLTVFENIAFPLTNLHVEREEIEERVYEMASLLNLTACLNRKPKRISGGQQQRVALARALIKQPDACCLDEPFSNTDALLRDESLAWVKTAFHKCDTTAIYVTHDLREAAFLADHLFVIDEGKLVLSGTAQEVLSSENEVISALREGSGIV